MAKEISPGTRRVVRGQSQVFYEGYWVKTYPVPEDTLNHKKLLIEALTRRLFNHTEHGLNIPGHRLGDARRAYEEETDPARKRVKGAMFAGAMFNRATDIFKRLVELQSEGIEIQPSNELMRECGRCLEAAYSLCRLVLHRSGEESIDELWGEPFRAFSVPLEEFYETRYLKIGQGKRDIDAIAQALMESFAKLPMFPGLAPLVADLARAAKVKIETLRTDPDIFVVWADFVTAGERLVAYEPVLPASPDLADLRVAEIGRKLIANGRDLIFYITRARVSMPKSTREFIARCRLYAETGNVTSLPVSLPA